ncbi:TIGR00296 family protein [Methanofollis formosanus]|uniref:Protein E2N92_00290 n=1 Tax=Methanofollis formosanus TaxID=299308 RepID=A0A8G0ZW79_9EURY|nr:TIGR00296 family protein [Methanofollis formosanus]QYZ77974.1 TIGR00296 family protein [Methanofollis formosanus]
MFALTSEEGRTAVRIARAALEKNLRGEAFTMPDLPPAFSEKRGVFVTLTAGGNLRGCIGLPYPVMPLAEGIVHAALSAALEDPRFPAVRPGELAGIRVEVTVLSVPEALACPAAGRAGHVEVGRHGLVVSGRGHSGLLLPQVATEYEWNAEEFLDHTCLKAGLPQGCWRRDEFEVAVFEGQVFTEEVE